MGLVRQGPGGRTVTVKIKYADFQQATRSWTFDAPVMSQPVLRSASLDLVRTVCPPSKGIRPLGVAVSGFEDQSSGVEQPGFDLEGRTSLAG
jgi:DNA polymerase-4